MRGPRPPIVHASDKGYPACGAKQRPMDRKRDFAGDSVYGELMPAGDINCPRLACMRLRAMWLRQQRGKLVQP